MKRKSKRNRVRYMIVGVVVLLLVALGGFALVRHNQQTARIADAGKVFKELKTQQATLRKQTAAGWVGDFVEADVNATTLKDLEADLGKLDTAAEPYAQAKDKDVVAKYQAFTEAQNGLRKQYRKLHTAYTATTAVNKLFQSPVQEGATSHDDVVIKEKLSQHQIVAATELVDPVNATLFETLNQAIDLAQEQVKERRELKAQVALIATDGTIKDDATLEQLKAFAAFIAQLKYPKLAESYQPLIEAAAKKAKEMVNIKSISLGELQKRVLLAYTTQPSVSAKTLNSARSFFVSADESKFEGDSYHALIGVLHFPGSELMPKFNYSMTVALNGDYKLKFDDHDAANGNLMKDFSAEDVASVTSDPTDIVAPKITEVQFKAAFQKLAEANDGDPDLIKFDKPATVTAEAIELTANQGMPVKHRYDYKTGACESEFDSQGPDGEHGMMYDAELTTAIWQVAMGQ